MRSVIGVHSANPHGPLSLLARVPRLLKGAAVEGVISTKRAVRITAMRRAAYMVPTDTAVLAFRATSGGERARPTRSGIDAEAYERLRGRVLQVAQREMTAEEIARALPDPPESLAPALQAMCAEGVLLRIKAPSILSNAFTFCATEAWLGEPLKQVPREEALTWLAGDYLSAFGPVSTEDLAWWTGAPDRMAADALLGHDPVDVGGGYLLHRRDERAFAGLRPLTGRVNLLPKWDCYTMGYAPPGRARFAAPELLDLIFDAAGNAQPVVLVEGEVQGMWDYRATGDRLRLVVRMFDEPGPALRHALESEAELVASFLETGRRSVTLERINRPKRQRAAKGSVEKAGKTVGKKTTKKTTKKARPASPATRTVSARRGSTPRRSPRRRGR